MPIVSVNALNSFTRRLPERLPVAAATLFLVVSFSVYSFAQPTVVLEKQIASGTAALKSGDLETAEKIFSELLRDGVRNPIIFHNLAVISQQRGEHQKATARFREAIALQPNYTPSRLLLGSSLLSMGKSSEAVVELKHAVRLLPKDARARLLLARAYEASDNLPAAVEEYQKLVKLAPSEAEYSYQLGRALIKLSEWSYQRIARIDSSSARLYQSLGQEYLTQERFERAIYAYQQAVRADPKLPEIHLALAVVWFELKRFDNALVELELELKLVPESKAALEMKKRIVAVTKSLSP
ncbi:MAG: tetratricopeptide repeat protein [Acidobacteriota bacterium]|nr:tetratricopeptide repeat protein [Acidobacteriota bacterium]